MLDDGYESMHLFTYRGRLDVENFAPTKGTFYLIV